MTMEKPAIELIQNSANIPALIEHLNAAGTKVPLVALPDSMRLHDLEKHMEHAARYRMNYDTTSIADFIEYGKQYATNGSICFVNADAMTAKATFDLGTLENPGHKEHTATLNLKATAAFDAIKKINGKKMEQKEAAEFIEDWHDFIHGVKNTTGNDLTPHHAAAKLLDLSITQARELNSRVHDFGHQMSAMESIEAKNEETTPAQITFCCQPYQGLVFRDLILRVGILTGEDKPRIVLRITQLESTEEAIAEEFKALLADSFKSTQLTAYIGRA